MANPNIVIKILIYKVILSKYLSKTIYHEILFSEKNNSRFMRQNYPLTSNVNYSLPY